MEALARMFVGMEDYQHLLDEVFISSNCDVDKAGKALLLRSFILIYLVSATQLAAMGFQLTSEQKAIESAGVEVEKVAHSLLTVQSSNISKEQKEDLTSQALPTPTTVLLTKQEAVLHAAQPIQPTQPVQATEYFPPTTIPVSAPIPIPSPTKTRPTTNLDNTIYAPHAPARSDTQKVVGNLKYYGECIKKNCKKSKRISSNPTHILAFRSCVCIAHAPRSY
jgi:hypothetical protein